MGSIEIKSYGFSKLGIESLGEDQREINWPVIYQIFNDSDIYIGETTNLKNRMFQHLQSKNKSSLEKISVVYDDSFNKSVALDLEAQLIQWFSADGKFSVLNRNDGIADRAYFGRESYQQQFPLIWDRLRNIGLAINSIADIENSGLFKFSPYKRLNNEQLEVVMEILADLERAFTANTQTISIVGGHEGTGKTIVLMYLIKLIRDIQDYAHDNDEETERLFDNFFEEPYLSSFRNKTIAVVIPNQSLRGSVRKIFHTISNLAHMVEVLSPIEFGSNNKSYDITFVDEAHLLKISNQEVHKSNRQKVDDINEKLFGDNETHTELDWVIKKSRNIVMVYGDQRVRPNNISGQHIKGDFIREHILRSQIRSNGGETYINYLREILSNHPPIERQVFGNFEFKLFGNFEQFVQAIRTKESEVGLSRLVAGFAWEWKSNKSKKADVYDIVIDNISLRWNSTLTDWIGSEKSKNEVGSIYTVQGQDLRYCGVIIGDDLKYDPSAKKLIFNKKGYFDRGAKKRTKEQIASNTPLTEKELLDQVLRTYRILLNRSTDGTYVYVCDQALRNYLSNYIETV